jgi:hypothetical protein
MCSNCGHCISSSCSRTVSSAPIKSGIILYLPQLQLQVKFLHLFYVLLVVWWQAIYLLSLSLSLSLLEIRCDWWLSALLGDICVAISAIFRKKGERKRQAICNKGRRVDINSLVFRRRLPLSGGTFAES